MSYTYRYSAILAAFLAIVGFNPLSISHADTPQINICDLVDGEQLAAVYSKPLFANAQSKGCFWNKKPGGMAYFHIGVHEYWQELRSYFNASLPNHVKLEKISDLGDGGLMTVTEGALGVIVIRQGDWVLQSAVTFLDIEPASDKQRALWQIYKGILKQLPN